jgi:hypothetical protein
LNEKGEKVTNPLNSLWKQAGMDSLQKHLNNLKKMKNRTFQRILKKSIEAAMHTTNNETILRNN